MKRKIKLDSNRVYLLIIIYLLLVGLIISALNYLKMSEVRNLNEGIYDTESTDEYIEMEGELE